MEDAFIKNQKYLNLPGLNKLFGLNKLPGLNKLHGLYKLPLITVRGSTI